MHVKALGGEKVEPVFPGAGDMDFVAGVDESAEPGTQQLPGLDIDGTDGKDTRLWNLRRWWGR